MAAFDLRPLTAADAEAVHALATVTFEDLDARLGPQPASGAPPPPPAAAHGRIRHLAGTDPGGAILAIRDGEVVGAVLALVREGVWGLSLLIVHPRVQSAGLGRELLAEALVHGDRAGAHGGIILASDDARALRAYSRAGFDLHPTVCAHGRPQPVAAPAGCGRSPLGAAVRPGGPDDLPLTEAVDRAVRGAAHGTDILAMLDAGLEMLVLPDRGYATHRGGELKLLAALDAAAATDLLRAFLSRVPAGQGTLVDFLTARQQWAIGPLLGARLDVRVSGAVFLRGELGPMTPYVPSGAYL